MSGVLYWNKRKTDISKSLGSDSEFCISLKVPYRIDKLDGSLFLSRVEYVVFRQLMMNYKSPTIPLVEWSSRLQEESDMGHVFVMEFTTSNAEFVQLFLKKVC